MTSIEGQSAEDLLVEAKPAGLYTTPYESLLTGKRPPGTGDQGPVSRWGYINQTGEYDPQHPARFEYVKEALRAFGVDFL